MLHPVAAFIGLRYARASKSNHFIAFINMFSVMGITLGIAALIVVSSVMNGFENQLKQRILGLQPQVVVDTQGWSETQLEQLQQLEGVKGTMPFIESQALIQSTTGLKGIELQGVDAETMARLSSLDGKFMYGSMQSLQQSRYSIILGFALARELGVRPGDQLRVLLGSSLTYSPFGAIPTQRLFTVAGIYALNSELDSRVVMVNVEDLARLQRIKMSALNEYRLFLDDAFELDRVTDRVNQIGENNLVTWRERQGKLFDAVAMEKNMMSVMLFLIILVAAFNIVSALAMVVSEKQADIAILLTQGMRPVDITSTFMINGVYNGIKGTLFGGILGLCSASYINEFLGAIGVHLPLPDDTGLPVVIDTATVLSILIFAILLSLLASIYPAINAARVKPATALRYE